MVDALLCPSCGTPSEPPGRFCSRCGRNLSQVAPVAASVSTYGQVLSAGGPPSIFHGSVATPPAIAPGTTRPFGILALAVFVVASSIVGLFLILDYGYWANWRFSNDEFLWGLVDAVFALAYVITSVYGLRIARKLWDLQPSAWSTANLLILGWAGLDLAGIVLWGLTSLSLIGLVGMGASWVYLNLTATRALFGQKPLTTSTPAS